MNGSSYVSLQQTCAWRKTAEAGGERRGAGDSGGGRCDGGERRAIVAADSGTAIRRSLDGMRRRFALAGDRSAGTGGERKIDSPGIRKWA